MMMVVESMSDTERVVKARQRYVRRIFDKWKADDRTLASLARRMYVTRQALSDWKSGRRNVPEIQLHRLCIEVGIDLHALGPIPPEIMPRRRRRSA